MHNWWQIPAQGHCCFHTKRRGHINLKVPCIVTTCMNMEFKAKRCECMSQLARDASNKLSTLGCGSPWRALYDVKQPSDLLTCTVAQPDNRIMCSDDDSFGLWSYARRKKLWKTCINSVGRWWCFTVCFKIIYATRKNDRLCHAHCWLLQVPMTLQSNHGVRLYCDPVQCMSPASWRPATVVDTMTENH